MYSNILTNHRQSLVIFVLSASTFICGCSEEISIPENSSHLSKNTRFSGIRQNSSGESTLDIFAFEDDLFKRLDSYQRLDGFTEDCAAISSTGGEKIFFFCMNSRRNIYDWSEIRSYSSLKEIYCELEDEDYSKLTMTAEASASAGDINVNIEFIPLTCQITVKALGCDFSGTPYASSSLEDIKVYLTNVSASCPIICHEKPVPVRIINSGMLNNGDMDKFRNSDIIYQTIEEDIFKNTIYPDINLLCYPNSPAEESPGSPFTRLVIEGKIESETYYWPLNIGADLDMERGCRYVYDILIRRKGVSSPDIPIDLSNNDINITIKPWIEKDSYTVGF